MVDMQANAYASCLNALPSATAACSTYLKVYSCTEFFMDLVTLSNVIWQYYGQGSTVKAGTD